MRCMSYYVLMGNITQWLWTTREFCALYLSLYSSGEKVMACSLFDTRPLFFIRNYISIGTWSVILIPHTTTTHDGLRDERYHFGDDMCQMRCVIFWFFVTNSNSINYDDKREIILVMARYWRCDNPLYISIVAQLNAGILITRPSFVNRLFWLWHITVS